MYNNCEIIDKYDWYNLKVLKINWYFTQYISNYMIMLLFYTPRFRISLDTLLYSNKMRTPTFGLSNICDDVEVLSNVCVPDLLKEKIQSSLFREVFV